MIYMQLIHGRIFLTIGAYTHQVGILSRHAQQLVTGLNQLFVSLAIFVLQEEVKTVGRTQLNYRRRYEGKHEGFFHLAEHRHGTAGNRLNITAWSRTFRPVFQSDEGDTHVLPLTGKTEARHTQNRFDVFVCQELIRDFFQYFHGTFLSRVGWQYSLGKQHALIFVRQEGGWHTDKDPAYGHNQRQIDGTHTY